MHKWLMTHEREEHGMNKKVLGLFLMLVFVISGCAADSELISQYSDTFSEVTQDSSEAASSEVTQERSKMASVESSEVSAEQAEIESGIKRLSFWRAGGNREVEIISAAQEQFLQEQSMKLPERFSIYQNLYPYGQGGLLFDVDEVIKKQMEQNLICYLQILYGEDAAPFSLEYDPSRPDRIEYENGETSVGGSPGHVSLSSSESILADDIKARSLEKNELVVAAIQYLGLENPSYQYSTVLGHKGDISEYTCIITEETDDPTEYAALCSMYSVHITYFSGSTRAFLLIREEGLQKVADEAAVPYPDALAYIRDKYPDVHPEDIKVGVQYSSQTAEGYFIPVYKFYVKQETITLTPEAAESILEETAALYRIIYIQAVEDR